jgi:hypothetical protein
MTDPQPRPCSRCGRERDRDGQRYCSACQAAYMRDWRAKEAEERAWLRKITKGLQRPENRPGEASVSTANPSYRQLANSRSVLRETIDTSTSVSAGSANVPVRSDVG